MYKLKKDLTPHFEFYIEESQKLFREYKTVQNGTRIRFETPELAKDYNDKQLKIDEFEVQTNINKQSVKLSDIPDITIQQIEALEDFIEFDPE